MNKLIVISAIVLCSLYFLSCCEALQGDANTRARVLRRLARMNNTNNNNNEETIKMRYNLTDLKSTSYGIDISRDTCDGGSWVSSQQFPCFANKGKGFAVIETWNGGYGMSQSIAHCAAEAHAAGMYVSIYAFFCPNCGGNNPPYQVAADVVKNLFSQGVQFTYFYIDVEDCSGCWNDHASNANYISQIVAGAQSAGANVAIYTSEYEWSSVVGSYTGLSGLPLWYAHYDGYAGFGDFSSYGGWSSPHMKQYNDHSDVGCYTNVDVNFL